MTMPQTRPFTGRHIAIILIAFFGVVIAVNLLMARLAVGTFGGTVVDNSYVASQNFNDWLAQARSERALGWRVAVSRDATGQVRVVATDAQGQPLSDTLVTAVARHPLGRRPEQALAFAPAGTGFRSTAPLGSGRWHLLITIRRGGQAMRVAADLA